MGERHLLIHLDDSKTKQLLVEQAWLEAGGRRDDLLQTDDPQEVLGMIRDFGAEALAVVTDNDIVGHGQWALKVVEAATREGVTHILVYSGNIPVSLSPHIGRIARTTNNQQDEAGLRHWLVDEAHLPVAA